MKTVNMSERTYKQYINFIRSKRKKKLNKIDKILIAVLTITIIFIIVMVILFIKQGAVPDSLVVGYFGAVFGEVSICGWVKQSVEKNKCLKDQILESEEENE